MTDAICPYCRCPIDEVAGDQLVCTGCNTPHHQDCYAENGGCTIFGCSQAPPDEGKLSVSTHELSTPVAAPVPPPAVPAPTYMLFSDADAGGTSVSTAPMPAFASSTSGGPVPPPPPAPTLGTTSVPPPPRLIEPPGMTPSALAWQPPTSPRQQVSAAEMYNNISMPKDRVTFILLGIFLGMFGAHNFYAGYHKKAAFQLCITLLTCFYGTPISWIWAIVEVCIIKEDADGTQFT